MNKKYIISIVFTILFVSVFITAEILIITYWNKKTDLSFTDEDVIITINDTDADFYARYGLKNYGERITYKVYLPFALPPWDINLSQDGKPLAYDWTEMTIDSETESFETIIFQIELEPLESGNIIISYKRNYEIIQENNSKVILLRYIVGTTRFWDEALDFAHFEFWWQEDSTKTLLEERDFTKWMPEETFLYFKYNL